MSTYVENNPVISNQNTTKAVFPLFILCLHLYVGTLRCTFILWIIIFPKHAVSTTLYLNNLQKEQKTMATPFLRVATPFLRVTHPFLRVTIEIAKDIMEYILVYDYLLTPSWGISQSDTTFCMALITNIPLLNKLLCSTGRVKTIATFKFAHIWANSDSISILTTEISRERGHPSVSSY